MHQSQLSGFIIDCQNADLEQASTFWGAALGMKVQELPAEEGEKYVRLVDHQHGLHIEVQRVKHESRVHLDIETDQIDLEVARLEKLGAKVVEKFPRWTVMKAPTGQKFCVVRASSPDFRETANSFS